MSEQQFFRLFTQFLKDFYAFYPRIASGNGLHQFDGLMPDYSSSAIDARVRYLHDSLTELRKIGKATLSRETKFSWDLLENQIEGELFQFEVAEIPHTQPVFWIQSLSVLSYVLQDYAPPPIRGAAMLRQIQAIPRYLESAKQTLRLPLGKPVTDVAIQMAKGMLNFYQTELKNEGAKLLEAKSQELFEAIETASTAIQGFIAYLEKAETADTWALGSEKYLQMLRMTEGLEISLEDLEKVAKADLKHNQDRLKDVLSQIAPGQSLQQALNEIKQDYPPPEELLKSTSELLETLRTMLIEQDFVSVPTEERCSVLATPKFIRAFAFAAMYTPGAHEPLASASYYFVSPPDEEWSAEKVHEWMTIFARPMLESISVHEAYPGHFLHFLHLRHRVTNPAARNFVNYHFVEGWAHYVEEVIFWETDWRSDDPRYKVAQLVEALIRNVRFLCSLYLHTKADFSVEDGTKLFIEEGYLDEQPALTEAMRGTFDPGYLNYTLGKLLVMKLREDYKREWGEKFSLRAFHDELLSYGAPPVPILRKYLLKDSSSPIF